MEMTVQIPKAFSVRDFNEFRAHQDLLTRMNPALRVMSIATGRHKNSGTTIFWGVVYKDGEKMDEETAKKVLVEAGLDLNGSSIKLNGISV